MPLTQFADTEGSFLFPPSRCSAGSCQLILVGLLKPFSLIWVGAGLCSAPLFECWFVLRIHSPSSMISIPSSSPSCALLNLILCFQSATLAREKRIEGCVFSASQHLAPCGKPGPSPLTPPQYCWSCCWVSPEPPFLQGRWALLPQSLPTGKALSSLAVLWLVLGLLQLVQAFPECCLSCGLTSIEQAEVKPLPCLQAVARLLLLLSPARARCWLVLCLLFADRTLGLFWELLSPTTLLFTHLIGHFSWCNIPTG